MLRKLPTIKNFGRQSNHFYLKKLKVLQTSCLCKDGEILTDNLKISEVFNELFTNIVQNLDICLLENVSNTLKGLIFASINFLL